MLKHRSEHFDPELLDVFVASGDELARIHEQYADRVNSDLLNNIDSSSNTSHVRLVLDDSTIH
jgi:hypothetical protein